MIWELVVNEVVAAIKADDDLVEVIGPEGIYKSRTRATIKTPQITYTVVSEIVTENEMFCVIQFDIFTSDLQTLADLQLHLYRLFHRDIPQTLGSTPMWTQFENGFDFFEQEQSFHHRAVVYRFTTARFNG